jgi:hypothetical protein
MATGAFRLRLQRHLPSAAAHDATPVGSCSLVSLIGVLLAAKITLTTGGTSSDTNTGEMPLTEEGLGVHEVDTVVNAGWHSLDERVSHPHDVSRIHMLPDLLDTQPARRKSLVGRSEPATDR